jgi:hypothetical protein
VHWVDRLALVNVPDAHGIQAETPVAVEYVPGRQPWQVAALLAPSDEENVAIGHGVHAVAPVELIYVPATHFWHIVLPVAEEEVPAVHGVQAAAPL